MKILGYFNYQVKQTNNEIGEIVNKVEGPDFFILSGLQTKLVYPHVVLLALIFSLVF